MKYIAAVFALAVVIQSHAQDKNLPYYQIPSYADSYSAGTVASRMVDGLGFRFYWATEGLRAEDLSFRPNAEARTSEETVQHIYSMSFMILNATTKSANVEGQDKKIAFAEMRKKTLENFKAASDNLRKASDQEVTAMKAIFKRGDKTTEFPFWNMVNGPIADCIWHVGQVVSFRRSSGNPFNDKANVFTGTVGE